MYQVPSKCWGFCREQNKVPALMKLTFQWQGDRK